MSNKEVAANRKNLAIKRADAEPLTRADLQFDLLRFIFEDKHVVFTDPHIPFTGGHPGRKVTFRDLYVNALINSPRSSKVLRDKMLDTPAFGTDFAKISLLANVGRINTTMAFFPEMRTALRTYHPVPALQKTDGNLQDAPRIKNTLKACLIPSESKSHPTTPSDVLMQRHAGLVPSTSVVNLIFVMASHSAHIGRTHLEVGLDFIDLFLPTEVASADRAAAFLWLCFHYLQAPTEPNPFDDTHASANPGKAPLLPRITPEAAALENVDPPEERAWGEQMAGQRRAFLQKDKQESMVSATKLEDDDGDDATPGPGVGPSDKKEKESQPVKPKTKGGKGRGKGTPATRKAAASETSVRGRPSKEMLAHKTSHQRLLPDISHHTGAGEPYPRLPLPTLQNAPTVESNAASRTKGVRPRKSKARDAHELRRVQSYNVMRAPPSPERTMLQHAWHIVSTTDPLVDSDEEHADEHVRLDYMRRLKTLNRLRGKSPTPEPPHQLPQAPALMDFEHPDW